MYSDDPFLCCVEEPTLSVEEDGEEVFEAGNFCHPENGDDGAMGIRYTMEDTHPSPHCLGRECISIDGVRHGNADLSGLPRGIYVVKSGGMARKVAVR